MDIKETVNKEVKQEQHECVSCNKRCVIPEDSTCICDIDGVCQKVNKFIESAFKNLEEETNKEKHQQIIESCKEALRFLEMYKNTRLNIELSRKIKFNIDPTPPEK